MRVAIVCVNYNSYLSLEDYLVSLECAASNVCKMVEVDVYIADNTPVKENINYKRFKVITVQTIQFNNLGYLGGAFAVINGLDTATRQKYDYYIISNVDVTVNNDFFAKLNTVKRDDKIAWIAPAIYYKRLNKIGKEELEVRPSLKRMKMYDYLYSHPMIYKCYWLASRLKMRSKINTCIEQKYIYAGYGSFMIFTNAFIDKQKNWEYKPFLFGEELFFAELARKYEMRVLYVPEICINDIGKVSTGKIPSKEKLRMQRESNLFLYNEFFRNRK